MFESNNDLKVLTSIHVAPTQKFSLPYKISVLAVSYKPYSRKATHKPASNSLPLIPFSNAVETPKYRMLNFNIKYLGFFVIMVAIYILN